MTDRPRFRVAFARLFTIRLVGNVAVRFTYPFLPTIADGLDTSLAAVGLAVAAGELIGLAGTVVGRRLDRIGRRRGMVEGLVVNAAGAALAAAAPTVVVFGAGLVVAMFGRLHYDVSLGAWIGDEVPFERRGRISGINELSWSGAFFVGVPVAGLLTSLTSWRVPFLAVGALLVLAVPVVLATLADDGDAGDHHVEPPPMWTRPTAIHLGIALLSFGAAAVFVTEGAWFEDDFGFDERTISLVVVGLGLGEMVGAALSAGLTDRIGKKPSIVAGLVLLVPATGLIAAVGGAAVAGVALAVLVGLAFELAFVSCLPVVVEVAADRRAAALGLAIAALTASRSVAAFTATAFYEATDMAAVALVAAAACATALIVVGRFVHEPAAVST